MQISRPRRLLLAGALSTAACATAVSSRRQREADRPIEDETARIRDLYEREAARYDSMIRIPECLLFGEGRSWAASQATGEVLEIAVGTGRNFPYYGPDVHLTGQDISLQMLEIARGRAQALGRDVELCVGDAQDLGFSPERFDAVVSTLALCTIPDVRRALEEAWRVLRAGGRLILLEHVRSPQPVVRALQRLLEPLGVRYAGDHLLRDPLDHMTSLAFSVEYCRRSRAGIVERLVARKVSDDVNPTTGGHHNA